MNRQIFPSVLGGPLFQLLMRLGLTTPSLDLLKKRIIYITLFAWLPLLLLSLVEGKAWGMWECHSYMIWKLRPGS